MNERSRAQEAERQVKLHLSSAEFLELCRIIERRVGLHLTPEKQRETESKLGELVSLRYGEQGPGLVEAARRSEAVLQNIVNRLTVGETYFFRNKPHFDALFENVFPELIAAASNTRTLRIWSAGCSGGEEAYSLAIMLREHFPETKNWQVSLTATDINTEFLDKAREGVYTRWSFRGVDDSLIAKYFTEEAENRFRLSEEIRELVRFQWFNLNDMPYKERALEPLYDLVLCRNVLIYFSVPTANKIVQAIAEVLRPEGYVFVGHSEAFAELSQFETVYSHATYYYRNSGGDKPAKPKERERVAFALPGVGVNTVVPIHPSAKVEASVPVRDPQKKARRRSVKAGPLVKDEKKDAVIVDEVLIEAREKANKGDLEAAFAQLEKLAQNQGKLDYRVHFLLAIVADQTGRIAQAVISLKQSIFLSKSFVIGHFYLGVLSEREGQNRVAVRYFRNVRALLGHLPFDHQLEEAEGLTVGRLLEIVEARAKEIERA